MSIIRFGEEGSDVYVYQTGALHENRYECCACKMEVGGAWVFRTRTAAEMATHLRDHQAAGWHVPMSAFAGLARRREP